MLHVGLAGMWAQEVSEKEAQERAQTFVRSHYGRKGGGPELKSLGQVNGLYVFNMNDKGGFVIVSNDERATDILGYSESGQFDPDNMPDNMRAWLQGYADEIAWAQKNIKEVSETNTKTRARTRAHATTTIAPMVTTEWDQLRPYNLKCTPLTNDYVIATGCAATAMAQVMYYTEKNTARKAFNGTEAEFDDYFKTYTTTTDKENEIESYPWDVNGVSYTLGPIPVNSVINWGKMTDKYTKSQTLDEESVDAVATLMMYCGYSIHMSYGSSSSAYTSDIALALKNYFGYSETTTHLLRYKYSYTDWVDMIYHELSQGRPVIYAGQAFDNGHAFICDGYQYKDNTDLFHINWGWSGNSDGYFVLSVLNPDDQGTGGSASNSAYTFGQEAIVGIQKDGDSGTLLNVNPLTSESISLTINSISLSHNPIALGESVDVTVSVTNNNSNNNSVAYDGEICLYVNNKRYLGKIFQIAAEATQDCVFTITPEEVGSYSINAKYPNIYGTYISSGNSPASLTVTDQTPSNLSVSNIATTSAVLSWQENGSATLWKVAYKTVSDQNFTEVDVHTNPQCTLTGLTPETKYLVKVGTEIGGAIRWSSTISFTTESLYPTPKNLTVSDITRTSAIINWSAGSANSYDIRYGLIYDDSGSTLASPQLQYEDVKDKTGALGNGSTVTWGVMYPGNLIIGSKLTGIQFFKNTEGTATITIKIYSGGDNAPGTLVQTINCTPANETGFQSVPCDIDIPFEQNLWITLTATGSYPMAYCNNSEPNNQWILDGDTWCHIGDIDSNYSNHGWMIRGFMKSINWTTTTINTNSYELTGLTSDKDYVVQVRNKYSNGDNTINSDWETLSFSTFEDVVLADNADNNDIIESHDKKEVCVSLTNRTLYKDGEWNTICLPFDLSADQIANSDLAGADIRALSSGSLSGGVLTLNFTGVGVVTSITAGTPYIIKWDKVNGYEGADPNTRDIKNPVFNGVTIDKTKRDVSFDGGKFVGTYESQTFTNTNTSILFVGNYSTLYYPQNGASIGAQRAYFQIGTNSVRAFNLNFGDDEVTGIHSTTNLTNYTNSGAWYDLSGRKLNEKPVKKGVYVQNGKKVVIK